MRPWIALCVATCLSAAACTADSDRPLAFAVDEEATVLTTVFTTALTLAPRPSTTTTAGPSTTKPEPLRSFSLAFTGDMLLHRRVNATAAQHANDDESRTYDYRPLMEPVRPWIEAADRAVCHQEVNLTSSPERFRSFPLFRVPGAIAADAKAVGFDACTTASNHTLDHGYAGAVETLDILEAAGLDATGSARTPDEVWSRVWSVVNGASLAHLSYTYWFNGLVLPKDQPWVSAAIDSERILSDAARARAEGADFIVVSMHWGDQYVHTPNRQQRELAPVLMESDDIDLIVGHHAHVVQPIELMNDKWLIHGLGNFLANYPRSPARRDELLVTVEVREQLSGRFEATNLEVLPMHIDASSLVAYPTSPSLRPVGVSDQLAADLDRSHARILDVLRAGSAWGELNIAGHPGPREN